jgi:hypothetical protein
VRVVPLLVHEFAHAAGVDVILGPPLDGTGSCAR